MSILSRFSTPQSILGAVPHERFSNSFLSKAVALKIQYAADAVEQALWALKDNRLRSMLSILGITIGVAAVMAVGAISKGGHFLVFSELQTFGLESVWVFRDYEDKDPNKAIRKGTGIEDKDFRLMRVGCCEAIEMLTPQVYKSGSRWIIGAGNHYSNGRVIGVGADYLDINNDLIEYGRAFRLRDETRRRAVAIIGPTVNQDLFGAGQNPVGKELRIGTRKFTVIGLLSGKSRDFLASIGSAGGQDANNRILVPYTVLQQMLGTKDINLLQAQAKGLNNADSAVAQITTLLERNHSYRYQYKSETMAQYIRTTDRILQGVSLIGVVAASVSLLVGGMGIMNIHEYISARAHA
jgi:ABC-type antimicrobial peptide transport system permease subunit